jgi:hypothetical protein
MIIKLGGTNRMSQEAGAKKPQLVLFSGDSALLEKLRPFSAGIPYIRCEVGSGPQITTSVKLDALWATLMAGVELFGAAPPFSLHEACVLPTPSAQRKRGLPRYGVVGVAPSNDESRDPEHSLRTVLSALLSAVKDFNSQNTDQINRVGILPDDLELKRLDPETGFRISREIYERAT